MLYVTEKILRCHNWHIGKVCNDVLFIINYLFVRVEVTVIYWDSTMFISMKINMWCGLLSLPLKLKNKFSSFQAWPLSAENS